MDTLSYLISAAALIIGVAAYHDPRTARLLAAILRSHAAAVEAGRKERSKVWRRTARAAGVLAKPVRGEA